jgi:hypothetical protein
VSEERGLATTQIRLLVCDYWSVVPTEARRMPYR